MKLFTKKSRGRFDLRMIYDAFRGLSDGTYSVSIKRIRKNRSNSQNGWLWGCIYPMLLDALIDVGWDEFTNLEQVHEFCKMKFTTETIVNKHTGEIVTIPHSTKAMNTTEFSSYTDKIREFASEYLNTEIPDPNSTNLKVH